MTFWDSTDDHSICDKSIAKIALCSCLVISFLLCLSVFSSPFFVISIQEPRNGCPRKCFSFPGLALERARRHVQWVTKAVSQSKSGPDHEADRAPHLVPTIRRSGILSSLPHMSA